MAPATAKSAFASFRIGIGEKISEETLHRFFRGAGGGLRLKGQEEYIFASDWVRDVDGGGGGVVVGVSTALYRNRQNSNG